MSQFDAPCLSREQMFLLSQNCKDRHFVLASASRHNVINSHAQHLRSDEVQKVVTITGNQQHEVLRPGFFSIFVRHPPIGRSAFSSYFFADFFSTHKSASAHERRWQDSGNVRVRSFDPVSHESASGSVQIEKGTFIAFLLRSLGRKDAELSIGL